MMVNTTYLRLLMHLVHRHVNTDAGQHHLSYACSNTLPCTVIVPQYVVLAWGESPADLELIERVLTQLCSAHRNDGGCTVVVMTMRSKIEMEELFR